jgi:DNA-binding LacI/PurR family transcriptional regulator
MKPVSGDVSLARKAVTIRDVARHAGVSVATTSRVLTGKDVVNPQTRSRILTVMEELGFSPSPAARRLSLGRTLTIGVVVSFLTRPQAAERLRGVDLVLTDSDLDLVIYNVETVQKRDHYLGTLAQSQRTDGLLVMSLPPVDAVVPALLRSPVPVVFIDVHTPSVEAMPRVVGDDSAGGALAARHLLDLGHRDIGFIGDAVADPFGFTSSRDREAGLTRALADAGVSIPAEWIGHGAHGRYEARDLARRMLSSDHRPTAIFTASDTQALGVIAAARELGLHVPDDLSVIGYDDIEAADYVGLTTIRQQLLESGRRGAEVLLAQIEDRSEEAPVVHLAPELMVRETTARPKEGRG